MSFLYIHEGVYERRDFQAHVHKEIEALGV